jgi:predicted transcriptional regulator
MSQTNVIKVLKNGSMTADEIAKLLNIPKQDVLNIAKKLRRKGHVSNDGFKYRESGEFWLTKFTLTDESKWQHLEPYQKIKGEKTMTQEAVIRALQNGPLTSYQLEDLTGIPRLSIAACCTKMRYKKKLKIEKVKMGRSWVSQYTLAPHMIEAEKVEEPRDLLTPFDIRNARGIFSKSEYASMNSQAKRLLGKQTTNEITNNQFI